MGFTLIAGALGWLTGAVLHTVNARSLPLPETETVKAFGDDRPILLTLTQILSRDEVNPDTLTATIGMLIGALEGEAEGHEIAMDWESLQVGLTFPQLYCPETRTTRSDVARVVVSAKRLAS